ncbi:MAG: helix-hairpin-helix domain-containing protein, partial [Clostridia bacterium]
AIELRDMLKIIEKIKERKLTALPKNIDIDIFTFATDGINRVINHIIYRQGRMQGGENYAINDCISDTNEVLSSFILQYFENESLPDEIITEIDDDNIESLNLALEEMSGKRFNLLSPKMGVRRGLVEMSLQNANEYLDKNIDKVKSQIDMTTGSAELLSEYLHLPYIKRMECFDISNISGVDKVASMVVFINGEKVTKHYRRFKIRTVEGANDFASMQEVVGRRLQKLVEGSEDESFSEKPDLIVVDGGKGQLSYAIEIRDKLGFSIPMIGLAEKNEEIYFPDKEEPLVLSKRDNALKMLIRMRDETHRFAITYFRSLHNKNSLQSKLDGIEGIGKVKKQALFDKFKTVSAIKSATVKELMEVDGIGKVMATEIEKYFKK